MSSDPLFDALSTLSQPEPGQALDARTQRAATRTLGRKHLRWAGWALGLVLLTACVLYLVVLCARAAALYG